MPDDDIMRHASLILKPDPSRTVVRPFSPEDPAGFATAGLTRAQRIADRVLAMDEGDVGATLERLVPPMKERHRHAEDLLLRRFEEMRTALDRGAIGRDRALLIGGYFCQEYAFEAAALFNPSMVLHPDQSGVAPGAIRFVLSLRGIGEGHVSSVTFRTGIWGPDDRIVVEPASTHGVPPRIEGAGDRADDGRIRLIWPDSEDISETVLFPVTPSQKQGIEDVRLVRFIEDDGTVRALGTYTAFSGAEVRQELLHIGDFKTLDIYPLRGAAALNKGMALFPRRIDGRYAMLGRQDNESLFYLASDDLHRWEKAEKIVSPRQPWEFVQMGNCGSPIEIDEGWLVLTHGVGLVRSYCIGACLLDKTDPRKVLARTVRPLLTPDVQERGGYVPNVVYSCGGMVHDRRLLLPYGVADTYTAFASAAVADVLAAMA